MKFGIFYEHAAATAVEPRRRVRAAQQRARPDRAGRPARLRLRLGGRAPLPRGVLALVGARGVPRRGQPAHEAASASATASSSSPTNHPARVAERVSHARPASATAGSSWASARGQQRHRAAPVRPPLPRQARGVGGRGALPACRCSARRAGSTTASTSTSRCATSCPSRARSRTRRCGWRVASSTRSRWPAGAGMGALGFQFVSAPRPRRPGCNAYYNTYTKRLDQLGRLRRPTRTSPSCSQFMCAPTDEEAQRARPTAATFFQFALRFYNTHGPVAPGTVNLWDEYQAWKQTPKGQKAHARRADRFAGDDPRASCASSRSRTSTR